ncbi:GntR family transcriptional regulator [Sinisalibacter aestuarii]|uniref:GntR family transcriptional regulator n=1 Tax=Sinisalibacter aestuarii TaxID=2949426 RepID=A0ABQ5LQ08_9RHOB|nr:GntR family transcriptional regulator [Sinisalibacter aestuarii]GKY87095.1 GntR family transcriptional regulator [Sinisalibacter aestuarii]
MDSENQSTSKPTAIETVQAELKRRILCFDLAPGERLHVDNLRREFDVSTATMREALSRLLTDNLVVSERQRGFFVRGLSLEDFRSLSEARKIAEVGAVRGSLANRDDQWEAELFAAYHLLKLVEDRMLSDNDMQLVNEWHKRNSRFHDCLARNCHNNWLIDFRRQLHEHSIRYLRLALRNNRKHRDVRKEHAAIFESAINGDVEACVRLVEQHIECSVADVEAYLPKSLNDFALADASSREETPSE